MPMKKKASEEGKSFVSSEIAKESLLENISLFYALVDQKTYQMSYCLVGDITAFVRYAETGKVERLKAVAGSLEKKGIDKLKTLMRVLNGRDRLMLFSPGISFCQSSNGDIYPLSSLRESFQNENDSSVHEVRNRILYDLEAFSPGTSL